LYIIAWMASKFVPLLGSRSTEFCVSRPGSQVFEKGLFLDKGMTMEMKHYFTKGFSSALGSISLVVFRDETVSGTDP